MRKSYHNMVVSSRGFFNFFLPIGLVAHSARFIPIYLKNHCFSDSFYLLGPRQVNERPEPPLGHDGGGQGVPEAGDLLQHFRGQLEEVQDLGHPHPGDPELPGQGSLRAIFPALEHLFPLPGENNRVPVASRRPAFLRFPPVGEHDQPEHRPKSSIY